MAAKEPIEQRGNRYEVTIQLPPEGRRLPEQMDLDVLIPPRDVAEAGLVLAFASFDEIDRLVSAGAEVTIRSKPNAVFPRDQIATEEEVRARVEQVTRLAEEGGA